MSRTSIPELRALRLRYLDSFSTTLDISSEQIAPATVIDQDSAMAIADAFESAVHSPLDSFVIAAYHKLAHETLLQWEFLIDAGYWIEPWVYAGQPYRGSKAMQGDVGSRHLYFFLTSSGFGEDDNQLDQTHNPLLHPSGIEVNGSPLLFNDLFRAVHDIFGHAQEGHEFGPLGEENAWRCHSSMFSAAARQALTTETRGQNSWFNFGPQMRREDGSLIGRGDSGFIAPELRRYAPQKMSVLPIEYVFAARCVRMS